MAEIVGTNQFRNGMHIELDGGVWRIVEFQHVKPGKGPAFVRTKLKNVESGKNVDKTFNAGTKVETATVDRRSFQYLYNDGSNFVFMDVADFDQVEVDPEIIGDGAGFLLENQEVILATNEGRVLFVELPPSVELVISYTEPGVMGDSATGRTKPATLETGAEIQVPLFIEQGEKIKVDTREGGSYLSRVKG
jgi:elongation factor P